MLKKAFILLFITITVFSCKKEQYQLKWKMPDNDGSVLIYKIQMETIDSLSSVTEDNMRVLVDMVAQMYGDSVNVPVTAKDLYQGLVRQLNMLSYFTVLSKGNDNELKINFITKQVKEYEQIRYLDIYNKFIRKAFFKGSLISNGKLISEEGGEVFDPKINILFELPEKPVGIGDSWSLNIKPPKYALNESQKDSIRNKVTFTDLLVEDGDSIAVLNYQFQSPDKSGNAIRFTGKVKFSLTQGKWLEYTGVLSQKTSGLLPMNHVQKIKLSEISIETYKSLIKQAQKVDLFESSKPEVNKSNQTDPVEKNIVQSPPDGNCPEYFRVQLLASQQPIKNKQAEFKSISLKIDEIVVNPNDKFKYKYTVGKECSKEKINVLLNQVKKSGYPNAYIIKTK
jgi:hypothetical protein